VRPERAINSAAVVGGRLDHIGFFRGERTDKPEDRVPGAAPSFRPLRFHADVNARAIGERGAALKLDLVTANCADVAHAKPPPILSIEARSTDPPPGLRAAGSSAATRCSGASFRFLPRALP